MKKLIALLLALLMVFSLVACGAKEEAPAASEEKTEAPATEEKTEAPAEEEEAPAEEEAATLYIPVMAKGFQHQFWQAVAAGSQAASKVKKS